MKTMTLIDEATMTLTPKPDKDPAEIENYRLKSLMNTYAKILYKLENCFQRVHECLVSCHRPTILADLGGRITMSLRPV